MTMTNVITILILIIFSLLVTSLKSVHEPDHWSLSLLKYPESLWGKPKGLLGKNADAETPESDPEHTVCCVHCGDLRLLLGSCGVEGAQCITRSGGGGQEQEARSEEHSGWSLAASVFIVCLDTTLKPEVGSKNRAFHLMRSGKLEAACCWRISVFKKSDNESAICNVALLLLSSQHRAV